MGTITMIAPTPGHTFLGSPSGTIYQADSTGIVASVLTMDFLCMLGMGCIQLFSNSGDQNVTYIPQTIAYTPLVITSNTFTLGIANDLVQVNKTTGSATAIAISAMTQDRDYIFQDMKGDAATNNITLTTSLGDGKINGANSFVINTNNESITLRYNGTTTTIN